MKVPIVKRKVEYYTEWVDLIPFLKKQNNYEIVNNRECKSVDIRLATRVDDYTHYVAHIPYSAIDTKDIEWLWQLRGDNRELEFIEKYQDSVVWDETYRDCVINTN